VNPIKSGFIVRNYVFGILLVLVACGIVVTDSMVDYPIVIRGYAVPGWSVYVLSVLLFIAGILLVASAGRGDRCAACNRVLALAKARFSLRDGDKIVHAVRELDAGLIKDLRRIKEGEPRIILVLDYCHACRRVAKIAVMKEDKKGRRSELVTEQIVTGATVWKFIDEIEKLREIRAKEAKNNEAEAKRRES
jgi:hypothetical protein